MRNPVARGGENGERRRPESCGGKRTRIFSSVASTAAGESCASHPGPYQCRQAPHLRVYSSLPARGSSGETRTRQSAREREFRANRAVCTCEPRMSSVESLSRPSPSLRTPVSRSTQPCRRRRRRRAVLHLTRDSGRFFHRHISAARMRVRENRNDGWV